LGERDEGGAKLDASKLRIRKQPAYKVAAELEFNAQNARVYYKMTVPERQQQ
jgi:hypothetical protein